MSKDALVPMDSTHVRWRGRCLVFFAGCDYFRLSWDPRVHKRLAAGLNTFGLNVAASRLTTGNHPLYGQLEGALATYFAAESATVVSTGYLSDLVAAEALAGEFSHAFLDSASHPSLVRAADLLGCPVVRFESKQPADLDRVLRRLRGAKPIVLTDGMFSRDGSVAPLAEYLRLLPSDGMLFVDDAHGAGVVGASGRGSLEACGVSRKRIVQTITLSKAFGTYGGAVLGTRLLQKRILSRSAMFVGSTPVPLPLVCAALESLKICSFARSTRAPMLRNAAILKEGLRKSGFSIPNHPGPIVALAPVNASVSNRARQELLDAGIYPSLIRYPGIPKSGYYRFVISSAHSPAQIDRLLGALRQFTPEELTPVA